MKSFKEFLRNGNWRNCQFTVRFISDLVNCHVVSATSLLQLFDGFMEGAIDPAVPQVLNSTFKLVISRVSKKLFVLGSSRLACLCNSVLPSMCR